MAESRIKNENYYQIQGWMINILGLKGVPLNVYAIIYGFSQDGESEYTGSLQYLCDFCGGVSKPTIINALKTLVEKDYIIRREEIVNGVQFNRYKVNLPLLKNLYWGGKDFDQEVVKNFNGGSKEFLPNNKSHNNTSKDKEKERKKDGADSFDQLIDAYLYDDKNQARYPDALKRKELLGEWLKVRKAKRAAMTDKAIQLNLAKLDNLASKSHMSVVQYLEEVICRGWASFFEIKNYGKTNGVSGVTVDPNATNDLDDIF